MLTVLLVAVSCKKEAKPIATSKLTSEFYTLFNKAEILYKNQDYSKAFYCYNKTKLIGEALNDNNKIVYSLMQMAQIQREQSDYSGSEATATEAISLFNKETHIEYQTIIYSTLGINYMDSYDYEDGLKYFQLALSTTNYPLDQAIIKNNIANLCTKKKEFKKAIALLLEVLKQKEVLGNPETHGVVLGNLGYAYFQAGDPSGIHYLKQSLSIRLKDKNDFYTTASYFNLAKYYEPRNSSLAKNYALKAYELATKINNAEDRLETLGVVLKNSDGNEFKKYSLIHLSLSDSLTKAKQIAKNQFAKIKYDATQTKLENATLKLNEERINNRNTLLYTTLISSFILSMLLYFLIRSKHKRETLNTSYTTETRISKKLHDELANDVFYAISYAETKDLSVENNKEKLLQALDTIYARTRNISRENSTIDTGINFVPYLKELISSYSGNEVNILVNGLDTISLDTIDNNKKIIIYRTIQELLVNMKKHSQATLVVYTFKNIKNKIQIDYSDNGVGIAMNAINLKNGLQNVENRIDAIKGTLTFDNRTRKGFKVSFSIPD
ncbi:ATP-binding protein [Flavobacterium luteum]|uniref:histidine kinase n=1 Tax=Flavobacterium luteum TaxID=2026654 RepID=A0A7J5A817_9FLAO|nr:ATP-binding protein [Flavobacterium luteum]